PLANSRGELVDQEKRQRRNVVPAVAERRQLQRENAQPVVEVLPKGFLAHGLKQVAVGCRQNPHIDPDRSTTANAVEFALLQDAEQLRLGVRRQLADLIEEDRAAMRQLESAHAPGEGACKGTLLVAEQLALHEPCRKSGAVDLNKRLIL